MVQSNLLDAFLQPFSKLYVLSKMIYPDQVEFYQWSHWLLVMFSA
jgi:hypothetical protein